MNMTIDNHEDEGLEYAGRFNETTSSYKSKRGLVSRTLASKNVRKLGQNNGQKVDLDNVSVALSQMTRSHLS
jgi:hypothetical protein